MKTFFDLMQDAQRNAATSMMAEQFGLSADQQAKAFEALMPAFWLGLRRNNADPFGVGRFWQSLAGDRYRGYFDNPFSAFTPSAVADGDKLVERMFGPELARAVALQVEAMTGITQDVVRRMMPVMANLTMGGLERQASEFENPFLRFLQDMTGGGQKSKPPETPFATFFDSLFGKEAEPEPEPEPESMSHEEAIDRLFDAGRSMQQSYLRSMEQIFERFADGESRD